MATQEVNARYEITFEDSASAAKFIDRLRGRKFEGVKEKSEMWGIFSSFEVDMTKEQEEETVTGKNPYNVVEVIFGHDFSVGITKGWGGSREEPPEPDELDGYQEKRDIEGYLKGALAACDVKNDYIEIEELEYESPSYEKVYEDERYYCHEEDYYDRDDF